MLSDEQKDLLALALAYGYPNRTDVLTSKDANACYSASQLIVWQITLGFRIRLNLESHRQLQSAQDRTL